MRKILTLTPLLLLATASALELKTVTVGNPGNDPDPLTGLGRVDYTYEICAYEITNAQFCEYANARESENDQFAAQCCHTLGITAEKSQGADKRTRYRYAAKPGAENLPFAAHNAVWHVPLLAQNFAAWMNGGEDGLETIDEGTVTTKATRHKLDDKRRPIKGPDGKFIMEEYDQESKKVSYRRKAPADSGTWYLANANELFKAAFHDAKSGTRAVYFNYATGSNTPPALAGDAVKGQKINAGGLGFPKDHNDKGESQLMAVGASSPSPYGAYDLTGNAPESYFTERAGANPSEYKIAGQPAQEFGGSYSDFMPFLSRGGCLLCQFRWQSITGNTTTCHFSNRVSCVYGFRLVRIKPEATPTSPAKTVPKTAPKSPLLTTADGDTWIAALPDPAFIPDEPSRPDWKWARDILAKLAGKTVKTRSEADAQKYASQFKRTLASGNIMIGIPLMNTAAHLEKYTEKAKCRPIFDLSDSKAMLAVWQDYNKLAPKGSKIPVDSKNFAYDMYEPLRRTGADLAILRKARMAKTGDITKFEQKTIESLKQGQPLLWLFDRSLLNNATGGDTRSAALVIGINTKTHEIIYQMNVDAPELYTQPARLPIAEAYAATTGLYQVQF